MQPIGNKHAQLLMYRRLSNYFEGGEFKKPWFTTGVIGFLALAGLWEGAVLFAVIRLWLEHHRGHDWAHLRQIAVQLETHELTEEDKALADQPLSSAEEKELDRLISYAGD